MLLVVVLQLVLDHSGEFFISSGTCAKGSVFAPNLISVESVFHVHSLLIIIVIIVMLLTHR